MITKGIWQAVTRGFAVAVSLIANEHAQEDDPEFQGIRSAACEVYAKLALFEPSWDRYTRATFLYDCGVWVPKDGLLGGPIWSSD